MAALAASGSLYLVTAILYGAFAGPLYERGTPVLWYDLAVRLDDDVCSVSVDDGALYRV